jgi:phage protein D
MDKSYGNLVSCVVTINGAPLQYSIGLVAIHVEQSINRIASAVLSIVGDSALDDTFAISSSNSFVPGNAISIAAGYGGANSVIFEGIVSTQSLRISDGVGPMLVVECKDKAVKMTAGRNSANHGSCKDSDILGRLIAAAGLDADVADTAVEIPTLVQYDATDWDFILSRAEVNGMLVSAVNNKVRVFDPTAKTTPALMLTYGCDLLSFNGELSGGDQRAQVTAAAQGVESPQLLSTITGEAGFIGTSALAPGSYLSLAGLGSRFSGDHFVSAVRHKISDGNWLTEAEIGLPAIRFNQQNAGGGSSAAGVLPGIPGLFVLPVMLDDQGKGIEVGDENGNSIVMSAAGIAIKSGKDISINAGNKGVIQGEAGVDISSGGDITVAGVNVKQTAQVGYIATGAASAEVSSSGQLTLKGAMVMIN